MRSRLGRRASYTLPNPYPRDSPLFESDQFRDLGLHPREAAVFQRLAERHRYEIFVRTSDASRADNVGRPGLRAKPAGVYAKTNKLKTPVAVGLVVYRDGDESKWERDLERINRPDPAHASRSMQVLANEGLDVRPLGYGLHGLRDSAGNFFYGDIDIHGVYRRTGPRHGERIHAETFVPQFNTDLTATGLHASSLLEYGTPMWQKDFGVLPHSPIQHGAHDEWSERNNANYAGGVNMGPLPGVIHFRRGAAPRYVATVAQYKDILASLGQAQTYTAAAWSNGRNRLAAVRYTRRDSAQQRDWLEQRASLERTRL
jgi:insecticidal toxin complex protein TccC